MALPRVSDRSGARKLWRIDFATTGINNKSVNIWSKAACPLLFRASASINNRATESSVKIFHARPLMATRISTENAGVFGVVPGMVSGVVSGAMAVGVCSVPVIVGSAAGLSTTLDNALMIAAIKRCFE